MLIRKMSLIDLYNEAIEVSNAAEVFDHLVDFDTTTKFVEDIQVAQKKLISHVLELVETTVISEAASGSKSATIFRFLGADLFEGFNILFMLFGGVEQERRDQLAQYGFCGCYEDLVKSLSPFYVRHSWNRATNENTISIYWE
ncbi:hypothetical protein PBCVNEJV1_457R [Paramecium bursaria Chlorella virus NE-JV-1]|nr:hypothetical protein PBCVNEJV1_457R [Paramecium bursaria Chlorella virus NE-JV-1]